MWCAWPDLNLTFRAFPAQEGFILKIFHQNGGQPEKSLIRIQRVSFVKEGSTTGAIQRLGIILQIYSRNIWRQEIQNTI